jgi:hypothetical protein
MIWQIERIVRIILIKQKPIHTFKGFDIENNQFFIKNNNNLKTINLRALTAYYLWTSFITENFDVKIFPPRYSY